MRRPCFCRWSIRWPRLELVLHRLRRVPWLLVEEVVFHPNIIGLTASREQIAQVAGNYGVKHEKKQLPDSALGYVISHSADIFVVDPQGTLCAAFPHDTDPEPLLVQIQRKPRKMLP